MILDFGDGRALQFPDAMPDETARQIKRWVLALEERARVAESEARLLRDELATVRQQVHQISDAATTNTATVASISELRTVLERGIDRLVRVASADRIAVPDPVTGDMTRSRIAL